MLKRILAALLLALTLAAPANAANAPVASFPDITSLTGTDIWYVERGGSDFHGTSTEIATFVNSVILGTSNTWTGTNAFGAASFSSTITATGLSAGTQVSCIGLDSGNHFVLNAAACGSGGGSGTVTTLTAGAGISFSSGATCTTTCTINSSYPSSIKTADYTVQTTDAGSTLVLNSASAHTFTGITATTLGTGNSVCFANQGAGALTLSTFGTVFGLVSNVLPGPGGQAGDGAVCLISDGTNYHAYQSQLPPDGTTITVVAGKLVASGGSGGVTVGATITGSCTSGFNLYDNAGVVGCQANGGGGGTVSTTGTPASGNLTKFSAATTITNGDLSGDCTTSGTLAVTCTKTSGSSFGTAATANTGTSGHTLPYLDGANVHSGSDTFGEVLGSENDQSGTTYTLVVTDCGKTVAFSNASAVTVTIAASIVPSAGTTCNIAVRQDGAGQVSVNGSAVTAATLVSAHSYTKTFGQHAVIGLELTTISATATAVLTGDGA